MHLYNLMVESQRRWIPALSTLWNKVRESQKVLGEYFSPQETLSHLQRKYAFPTFCWSVASSIMHHPKQKLIWFINTAFHPVIRCCSMMLCSFIIFFQMLSFLWDEDNFLLGWELLFHLILYYSNVTNFNMQLVTPVFQNCIGLYPVL